MSTRSPACTANQDSLPVSLMLFDSRATLLCCFKINNQRQSQMCRKMLLDRPGSAE